MRMRKEVFILSIDDILPNRFQPRIKFDEKAILELAESIKKHGVIQPIIVRKIADKYEIIAGERRYKASVIAGRTTIPAIITDVDDKESAEIALIENVQRQDMTPIEEAISYKKILDMGYLNQTELATKLGKTQSTIANKLRLLNLDDEVQESLLEEKISERHARSLLKLDKKDQKTILDRIIKERLTVRKTDQVINEFLNGNSKEGENMNNNYNANNMNSNFNIPNQPIIDNTNQINPGFMDISNIENNAQDINNENNIVQPEPIKEPFNPFGMPVEPVQEIEQPVEEIKPFNPFGIPAEPIQEIEQPVEEVKPFNPFGIPAEPIQEIEQPVEEEKTFNPFGMPVEPIQEIEQPVEESQFSINEGVMQPNGISNMGIINSFEPYSLPEEKELTPLMENNEQPVIEKPSLNQIINKIRECVNEIESLGFKIDLDEIDFENLYELNIKIEK